MMHHKIVIANDKWGEAGKTTSIRYAYQILSERYKTTVLLPIGGFDPNDDVKAIIEIPQLDGHIVKVGIESQGDPNSRQPGSIDDFIARGCEMMLVACRWTLKSEQKVYDIRDNHNWQVIWFDNSTMWVDSKKNQIDVSGGKLDKQDERLQNQLSRNYGFYVASLIERLVLNEGEL